MNNNNNKVTSQTSVAVESAVIKPFHLGKKKLEWTQDITAVVHLAVLLDGEDKKEPDHCQKRFEIFHKQKC